MKVYVTFNKQRVRSDGMIPIYIVVYRTGIPRLRINSGLYSSCVFENEVFPRSERNAKAKTLALAKLLEDIEKIALENSLEDNERLKFIIERDAFKKAYTAMCLCDVIDLFLASKKKKEGGISIYNDTKSVINRYLAEKDVMLTTNITESQIEAFTEWYSKKVKHNTVCLRLMNMKAAMNFAIRKGMTGNKVFDSITIKMEETAKRNLSPEEMRNIITMDIAYDMHRECRDIFLLSFYLCGANISDLLDATAENIVDGRFEYYRNKTGRFYSIKIVPEAKEILEKYAGEKRMLYFAERCTKHSFKKKVNCYLKSHIKDGVTTYYARHTWATIAVNLGIPIETISAALGHSVGSRTTNIYAEVKKKQIDEANRKVIDAVLNSQK